MKEVLETVSEVQFRSIAVIIAVASLLMLAAWWLVTGSASPTLIIKDPPQQAGSSLGITTDTPKLTVQQPVSQELYEKASASGGSDIRQSPAHIQASAERAEFTIQLGAFQKEEGARRQLTKLEQRGYKARLLSQREGDTIIHRLIFGDFRTYEEAAAIAKELRSAGMETFIRELDNRDDNQGTLTPFTGQ